MRSRLRTRKTGLALLALAAAAPCRERPFILGADISWLPQREAEGRSWYDQGAKKDALLILREHGFNWVRLRVFHDPRAPGGYSPQGWCGLESTLAMARRVRAAGMRLLIDFHYSDTWADPGAQAKPAAWAGLPFADLERAVASHTGEVLSALGAQGTLPDMVQIGNEINSGILLPDGSSADWTRFSALLRAGISAARAAGDSLLVMLHMAGGGDNGASRWFLDSALAHGLDFDVFGLSCYSQWHGPASGWESNFRDLAARYPDLRFVAAEYSQEKRRINDILYGLPGERGLGTFIWEPLEWEEAVFDWSPGGRWDSNALLDLYPAMAVDYGLDGSPSGTRIGMNWPAIRPAAARRGVVLRADGRAWLSIGGLDAAGDALGRRPVTRRRR